MKRFGIVAQHPHFALGPGWKRGGRGGCKMNRSFTSTSTSPTIKLYKPRTRLLTFTIPYYDDGVFKSIY